ncbi:hypothetical protein CesoFtcFv8_003176 [Champsocephalus esox]|uniref:Uncharacterized protein n=1 Tax=Champsocephalus esox TaxID=159716 RepID=A0AAN8CSI3_9TELE|nr:hypothetical protein CesoFtcFv8_003176 [Champsocephalus esox]
MTHPHSSPAQQLPPARCPCLWLTTLTPAAKCGLWERLNPPPILRSSSCGGTAEATVHPPGALSGALAACRQQQEEAAQDSPGEDPSLRSFYGKIKAFEKMDHFARAQRILELQEAQSARMEMAQKHPDIYAVPLKAAKLEHSRPQPIGSSSRPGPQTPPSSREGRPFCPSEEDVEEATAPEYYTANSFQYQDTQL